jgi:8-oxo-dGTP pyrophosphatase MutT (NUDIX family)
MSTRQKHATSSVFLFCSTDQGWRLGLIHHPRFGRWMLPGGHVEPHENPAEAAVREVSEETGLPAYLLSPPGLGDPLGAAEPVMPSAVWVVEQLVPPENREPTDHVHIDHLYLALTPRADVPPGAELRFGWFAEHDLDDLHMFPDTLARAGHLFSRLAGPAGPLVLARTEVQSPSP